VLSAMISMERSGSFAGFEAYTRINVNSLTVDTTAPPMVTAIPTNINAVPSTFSHAAVSSTRALTTSDYVAIIAFQSTGGTMTTRSTASIRSNLAVTEIPSW
jgi:hypothetical protein